MKRVLFCFALAFAIDLGMTQTIHAQDAATAVQAQAAQAAQPAPAAAPQVVVVTPAPAPAVVAVPEPAAPPQWATDLLLNVSKLPVIGPYVSKALLWLGILAAILTTLVAAALSILATLKGGFSAAGLDNAVKAVESFKNSKVMYYLTYFSNFNAQKPQA